MTHAPSQDYLITPDMVQGYYLGQRDLVRKAAEHLAAAPRANGSTIYNVINTFATTTRTAGCNAGGQYKPADDAESQTMKERRDLIRLGVFMFAMAFCVIMWEVLK